MSNHTAEFWLRFASGSFQGVKTFTAEALKRKGAPKALWPATDFRLSLLADLIASP